MAVWRVLTRRIWSLLGVAEQIPLAGVAGEQLLFLHELECKVCGVDPLHDRYLLLGCTASRKIQVKDDKKVGFVLDTVVLPWCSLRLQVFQFLL